MAKRCKKTSFGEVVVCSICPYAIIIENGLAIWQDMHSRLTTYYMGKLITIEGIDGAGKGTQTDLLVAKLKVEGHAVVLFDFPRYGNPSAWYVEQYLNGAYGSAESVGPYLGSFFFAVDRREAAANIKKALSEGAVVVCNRYVGSNLAHQGGKITDKEKRHAYFKWNDRVEYEVHGIPQPDINPVLFIPPEASRALVLKKAEREHLQGKKLDLHEADIGHLENTYAVYRELVRLFPEKYVPVECFENSRHLSPEEIHEKIWTLVAPVVGRA